MEEMPNDFSNGYPLTYSEILILLFMLCFWLFAVRKFITSFNKIRTTHYREINHKYKVKDTTATTNKTANNASNLNHKESYLKKSSSMHFQANPINIIIKVNNICIRVC